MNNIESNDEPKVSIENRDFYEFMQSYRHTPIAAPWAVSQAYQDVIKYVNGKLDPLIKMLTAAIVQWENLADTTESSDDRARFTKLAAEARAAIINATTR